MSTTPDTINNEQAVQAWLAGLVEPEPAPAAVPAKRAAKKAPARKAPAKKRAR